MAGQVVSISAQRSYLSALREMQLNDNVGVVLPSQGKSPYRFARASDALSIDTRDRAKAALMQMQESLANPGEVQLLMACQTVLNGNPKILAIRQKYGDIGKALNSGEVTEVIRAEYMDVVGKSLRKVGENLTVLEQYGQRVGGRAGALGFIGRLKECNPVDFLYTQQDKDEINHLYPQILAKYMAENAGRLQGDKKNLTIEDTLRINQLVREALGSKNYRMLKDPKAGEFYIQKAQAEGRDIDAGLLYEARLAEKLYPTLEMMFKEGKIAKDKPIYLLELGNNHIQNNMQTYLIWKVINKFLDHTGRGDLRKDVLKPVRLVSFGGHPQTATFDAHIEVEESQQVCKRCQEMVQKSHEEEVWIFHALKASVGKLSPAGQDAAKAIFLDGGMTSVQKLDALLQNDLTRDIFRITVGPFSTLLHPDYNSADKSTHYSGLQKSKYFFRGSGESTTHGDLMLACGNPNIPIVQEEHSRNTGENVLFFEESIPHDERPVVIPIDFCPVGRQVVTYTHQSEKWSTVCSSLLDLPMEYYRTKLREEQLYIETASFFAELVRNILYRTADNFVDAFPIDDRNYQLLWDYYVALKGYSPLEAEQHMKTTSIKTIFDTVKNAFVQFENSIPHGPVMDKADPRRVQKMAMRLKRYYLEMQGRAILRGPVHPDLLQREVVRIKQDPQTLRDVPAFKVKGATKAKVVQVKRAEAAAQLKRNLTIGAAVVGVIAAVASVFYWFKKK